MSDLIINNILAFLNEYFLYVKIIVIVAIIFHCIYKRYDKLSVKYRSKAFAILIFSYLIVDLCEGIVKKFYTLKVFEAVHERLDDKIDSNYIDLDTKIKVMSDKIYDDYNIKPKDTLN